MIQLKIEQEDTKSFMSELLIETTFDNFEVRNIDILTFTKFEISCKKNNKFYDETGEDSQIDFLKWIDIKPYIVNIIKGKKIPTSIKIIFSIPEIYLEKIHNNAKTLFLNLSYENKEVIFTTGSSQKEFKMDKSLDTSWDNYIVDFFKRHEITASLYNGEE